MKWLAVGLLSAALLAQAAIKFLPEAQAVLTVCFILAAAIVAIVVTIVKETRRKDGADNTRPGNG